MTSQNLCLAPELLFKLVQCAGSGIVLTNATLPDNPIIFANKAFYDVTQLSPAEVIGFNCRLLQAGDSSQAGIAVLKQAITGHEACHVTLRNYKKDGTMFWNELFITPYFDESGELTNYIGIQNDVTARIEKAQQKEMFNNGLLHDIKGALYGQSLVVDYLAKLNGEQNAPSVKGGEAHMLLLDSLKSTLTRISQTLVQYKLENDMVSPVYNVFSVNDLVAEVIDSTRMAATDRSLRVVSIAPGGDRLLNADRAMVFRALKNLTENAIINTDSEKCIRILSSETSESTLLSVLDEGPGLPDHISCALTNRSTQINSAFANTRSTGLGLMTCSQIMRLHGGSLSLLRSDNDGTDLALVFPKAKVGGDEANVGNYVKAS